jgi:hypothetical protein
MIEGEVAFEEKVDGTSWRELVFAIPAFIHCSANGILVLPTPNHRCELAFTPRDFHDQKEQKHIHSTNHQIAAFSLPLK